MTQKNESTFKDEMVSKRLAATDFIKLLNVQIYFGILTLISFLVVPVSVIILGANKALLYICLFPFILIMIFLVAPVKRRSDLKKKYNL